MFFLEMLEVWDLVYYSKGETKDDGKNRVE